MACFAAGRRGREVRRVDGNPYYRPYRYRSAGRTRAAGGILPGDRAIERPVDLEGCKSSPCTRQGGARPRPRRADLLGPKLDSEIRVSALRHGRFGNRAAVGPRMKLRRRTTTPPVRGRAGHSCHCFRVPYSVHFEEHVKVPAELRARAFEILVQIAASM